MATSLQQLALDWIFAAEGGYSDDPDDPGGTTKYGISLRYLKKKGLAFGDIDGDGDIDADDIGAMTREKAAEIYLRDFWDVCRCSELPPEISLAVFDMAVNAGVRTASRLLQEMVRTKVDGVIGEKTIAAAWAHRDLLSAYEARRALYYHDITIANSKLAKFLKGWFNRTLLNYRYILEEVINP